ncbi:MAG: IS30 family transposase, partial [Alphaproteobacteria bacterium]|nr:IS30 family transposase [Alphaproteobacteria bacterium]
MDAGLEPADLRALAHIGKQAFWVDGWHGLSPTRGLSLFNRNAVNTIADSSSQCIILWKGEGVTSCTHERLLMSRYRRVTYEDRCQIYALSQDGACQEAIARVLGLSQSTVSRELRRNRGQRGYRFKQAETKAQARQAIRHKPRKLTASVRRKVEAKLRQMRWSPEQISGWLREQGIGLSHER